MSIRCALSPDGQCAFGDAQPFLDRSGMLGEVSVARCRHCGIGLSLPPLADVSFLYADRSSQDFQQSRSKLTQAIKRIAFGRQARALLRQAGGAPRRIIDFGCGGGLFTRRLSEVLPGSAVTGTDFHDQPPIHLGTHSYRSFDGLSELAGSADLVLAMHVLEHDDDPMSLLKKIVALARPGGRVLVEVPNIDCMWAAVFGRFWDGWYLPYHRVHFSRISLRRLVEAAGLKVDLEAHICVPTMGRTVANLLRRRSDSVIFVVLGIVLHPIQWLGEQLSRQGSALRVIARVPG